MLKAARSRPRSQQQGSRADDGGGGGRQQQLQAVWQTSSDEEQQQPQPPSPIQAADKPPPWQQRQSRSRKSKKKKKAKENSGKEKQNKKKKKQPAIVGFFKRMKLRPLWRRGSRSRSRSRRRRHHSPSGDESDAAMSLVGLSPGALDVRWRHRPQQLRRLLSATALGCLRLDPWGCPYDFAVQGDRVLVPGLDVAEFSLQRGGISGVGGGRPISWPGRLGGFVPLCIDATPGLVYLTAASSVSGCGLFVFDRCGRLMAARRDVGPDASSASSWRYNADDDSDSGSVQPPRRPGMFAVRVNFRGECWVTSPRDLCVDHYTASLRRIRSIDVARFGVPYYLTAHSHRLACLWVSFPETRRVVKFDWLTLEPLCHLAFGANQTPCGLHLDELGGQLYVTDIDSCRLMVYHAATMGLADASTRAANEAVAAASERPAAIRLEAGRLLLLSCSTRADRCRIDVYAVAFGFEDSSDEDSSSD